MKRLLFVLASFTAHAAALVVFAVANAVAGPYGAIGLPYLLLGSALLEAGDAAGARQNLERAASFPSQREAAARELKRVGTR